jgi:hypothetical protein
MKTVLGTDQSELHVWFICWPHSGVPRRSCVAGNCQRGASTAAFYVAVSTTAAQFRRRHQPEPPALWNQEFIGNLGTCTFSNLISERWPGHIPSAMHTGCQAMTRCSLYRWKEKPGRFIERKRSADGWIDVTMNGSPCSFCKYVT